MLVSALILAACATSTRPFESAAERTEVPLGAVALFDAKQQPIEAAFHSKPREHLNILVLSGGGSNGAFGAGVLRGWSESGTRPKFDIVTGISTGALIASLAFLGPRYDGELKKLYTKTTAANIYTTKGFSAIFSDSFLDYTPFKKQIEGIITEKLLDEIAVEHRAGRRLYVGTTNLDAGELVVWDMGAIAASGHPARVRVFQKVLRASAAVPGFFKPVYIQPTLKSKARQMHVDGGVKAPVLIRGFMFEVPAKKRSLYVIVNGQMKLTDASQAVKPKLTDISRKSINELLRGLLYKTLYQGYVTARNAKAHFRLMVIPDNQKLANNPLKFKAEDMSRLFALGRSLGAAGRWAKEPPRLEDLERVAVKREPQRKRRRRRRR